MESLIKKHYPKAMEGEAFTQEFVDILVNDHGFELDKTLLATSVCSDEIIRSATNFRDHLENGNPFQLGGLAGYPFTGLTGLKAFAGHIPDDGSAIILYGPHIGFSKSGKTGLMRRPGQHRETTCCGALVAGMGLLKENAGPASDPELDYQMWKIESELSDKRENYFQKEEPLIPVTEQMYHAIDSQIKLLCDTASGIFEGNSIALVGGIVINTDFDLPDWFALRDFEVREY